MMVNNFFYACYSQLLKLGDFLFLRVKEGCVYSFFLIAHKIYGLIALIFGTDQFVKKAVLFMIHDDRSIKWGECCVKQLITDCKAIFHNLDN